MSDRYLLIRERKCEVCARMGDDDIRVLLCNTCKGMGVVRQEIDADVWLQERLQALCAIQNVPLYWCPCGAPAYTTEGRCGVCGLAK